MKCKPFNALFLNSIPFVANHRIAFFCKMDPDLILPAGQQIYFQKTVLCRFSQNFISGPSQLTPFRIGNGIHFMNTVFCEKGSNYTLLLRQHSAYYRIVFFLKSPPLFLQITLGILVFRKHDNTGSISIQTMYDKYPVSRFLIPFAHIISQEIISRIVSDFPITYGQKTAHLIHNQDIPIFIEN